MNDDARFKIAMFARQCGKTFTSTLELALDCARAEALGIEVRTPISLRDKEVQAAFAALDADVAVVAAYGLILPRAVLDALVFAGGDGLVTDTIAGGRHVVKDGRHIQRDALRARFTQSVARLAEKA